MTIREDGIPNNVSIYRTTQAPRGNENPTTHVIRGNEATNWSTKDAEIGVCANTTEDTANPKKSEAEATEYVVDHIVRDVVNDGEKNKSCDGTDIPNTKTQSSRKQYPEPFYCKLLEAGIY